MLCWPCWNCVSTGLHLPSSNVVAHNKQQHVYTWRRFFLKCLRALSLVFGRCFFLCCVLVFAADPHLAWGTAHSTVLLQTALQAKLVMVTGNRSCSATEPRRQLMFLLADGFALRDCFYAFSLSVVP